METVKSVKTVETVKTVKSAIILSYLYPCNSLPGLESRNTVQGVSSQVSQGSEVGQSSARWCKAATQCRAVQSRYYTDS